MRRIGRRVWHNPWMTLNATVCTLCVVTVLSIRWLMMLGVIHEFTVVHQTARSGYARHGLLGLGGVPSARLTDLDHLALGVGLGCGILWVLRLGLRAMGYRVGVHAYAASPAWTVTVAALQLAVALGGWLLTAFFTWHWLEYLDRRDDNQAMASALNASTI